MELGELSAKITAQLKDFDKNIDDASRKINDFGKTSSQASGKATTGINSATKATNALKIGTVAVAGAAIAAGGAMIAWTVKSLQANDAQIKLAKQMGFTNLELQTMARAADLAGLSINDIQTGFKLLSDRLIDARDMGGEAARSFEKISVSVNDLISMSPEEQMIALADAMEGVTNRTERAAIASDLFGRNGQKMLLLLEGTDDTFKRAKYEAETFGLVLNDLDSSKIEAASDNIGSLKSAFEGVARQLTASMAPAVERITSKMLEYAGRAAEAQKNTEELRRTVDRLGTDEEQKLDKITVLKAEINRLTAKLTDMEKAGAKVGVTGTEAQAALRQHIERLQEVLGWETQIIHQKDLQEKAEQALLDLENKRADAWSREQEQKASDLKTWLDKVNNAYSQTTEAKKAALDAEIAWFENAQKEADKTAGMFPPIIAMLKAQRAELDGQDEFKTAKLDQLKESLLSEEDALRASRETQRAIIQEAYENEAIDAAEHNELMLAIDQQYLDKLEEIRRNGLSSIERLSEQSWHQQAIRARDELIGLTQTLDSSNKKQFKIVKAGAIAQAIVNTYQGVTKSLSTYAWPLAGVMAAAHLTAGLTQVNNIRKQQYSSSSGGIGAGVTGATPTVSAQTTTQQAVTINLQGETYKKQDVVALISEINEAISDGAVLRVAG